MSRHAAKSNSPTLGHYMYNSWNREEILYIAVHLCLELQP